MGDVFDSHPAVSGGGELVGEWVNLRDDRGHVQASYNPVLMLLIIKERGKKTMHDLRKLKTPSCQERTVVLG